MDGSRDNVILVVHETSRTGAPILGWNIARYLAARYNVFTITLGDGPLTPRFEALSAQTHGPFERDRTHPADIEYALRPLLDRHDFKYAIINSCESRPVIEACVTRLIPSLLLMHEFGSYVYARDSLRAAFDLVSEIVFPAPMVAESSFHVHPPLRDRSVRILPQGMSALPDAANVSPAALPSALEELAVAHGEGAFIVLGAGSVIYRKGVDLFLAAAMTVCREATGRRVHFLWVGRGYDPDEDMGYSIYLREQLERSGLRDSVTFIGEVSDLDPIYALADVFLLTSRLDPLPNVSIDAAHRGIPIICFRGASGTADILLSDPQTAVGVVDHLDPAAAGRVILSLIRDRALWSRMAAATRTLAQSVFDMAAYCDALDKLGLGAAERFRRLREDSELLCRTDDFDQDLFLGAKPAFEARDRTIRRAVALGAMPGGDQSRRTAPGFNPLAWRRANPGSDAGDPLAGFIRAGRPDGPWCMPVLRPPEHLIRRSAPGIKALLHVHLTGMCQAADLVSRLQANEFPADLVVSTDTAAKVEILRSLPALSGPGTIFVIVPGTSPFNALLTALRRTERSLHDVVGHLHDGGGGADNASIDFQWTALLGARHPMLDLILNAFADQPALGLVSPCDPLPADRDGVAGWSTGGMFWARRGVLDCLECRDIPARRSLPDACDACGLTRAVTHLPGVFV